jgi:hypothetical protein
MPLSTSNSELVQPAEARTKPHTKAHRSILVVLIGLVVIWLASEAGTLLAVHRVSKIMRRTQTEYRDAKRLQRYSADGKPTMLLFGNSLLLEGVDYPGLTYKLSDEYDVHRLIFELTDYLEEYYVLRKLFRQGALPHDVVMCLSVNQFIGDDIRGDFMASYMDSQDILRLGGRRHMDATSVSGLLFAHFSQWFADRGETRKAVLGEMKELCDRYGVRLTIVVPPTLAADRTDVLKEAGRASYVRVLVPVEPGGMNASFFRDRFHLNQAGAAAFTPRLGSELAQLAP